MPSRSPKAKGSGRRPWPQTSQTQSGSLSRRLLLQTLGVITTANLLRLLWPLALLRALRSGKQLVLQKGCEPKYVIRLKRWALCTRAGLCIGSAPPCGAGWQGATRAARQRCGLLFDFFQVSLNDTELRQLRKSLWPMAQRLPAPHEQAIRHIEHSV